MKGLGGGGVLTAYERARLRLDVWKALDGWGTTEPVADDAPELLKLRPPVKPWDWAERKIKADELYDWLTSTSAQESEPPAYAA